MSENPRNCLTCKWLSIDYKVREWNKGVSHDHRCNAPAPNWIHNWSVGPNIVSIGPNGLLEYIDYDNCPAHMPKEESMNCPKCQHEDLKIVTVNDNWNAGMTWGGTREFAICRACGLMFRQLDVVDKDFYLSSDVTDVEKPSEPPKDAT